MHITFHHKCVARTTQISRDGLHIGVNEGEQEALSICICVDACAILRGSAGEEEGEGEESQARIERKTSE